MYAAAIDELACSLRGPLIRPGDPAYASARRVWNGMIDRHPSLIVRPGGVADVVAAMRWASTHGIPVAVRGGGHSVAGTGTCDDGLLLDCSSLRGVRVDPERRIAHALPGSTWADYDRETQAFGLASTGGLISHTGVAGLTLGGGIGWLTRKHGLACDCLRAVDMVTADGSFVQASERENAELFWGVRGGGGNLGIITRFEFDLYPLGEVLAGVVLYPYEQGGQVLRFYREYVKGVPDCLGSLIAILRPEHAAAHEHGGGPLVGFVLAWSGAPDEGERWLRPLREAGSPALDSAQPMPYTTLQSMSDIDAPAGLRNYWKADNLAGLSDGAIDALLEFGAAIPSPMTAVNIYHLGGALARVSPDATAFPHRAASYALNILSRWRDPAEDEMQIAWTREFWAAMQPHALGGSYVNFLSDEGRDRVRAAYGAATYERLRSLKRSYDPSNLLRYNQNVAP
jgi:FAD/FMN-containing dehydrogenase